MQEYPCFLPDYPRYVCFAETTARIALQDKIELVYHEKYMFRISVLERLQMLHSPFGYQSRKTEWTTVSAKDCTPAVEEIVIDLDDDMGGDLGRTS